VTVIPKQFDGDETHTSQSARCVGHPRCLGHPPEVGMLFTPLPEAYATYEGVKAFEEAGFAAWHLAWELDKK
jgi:hypothetical protein